MEYRISFIDTETDEEVDFTYLRASDLEEAEVLAWEEANYQGFHVGTIEVVK